MKGSLLTFVLCSHILFLQSFCALTTRSHGQRFSIKHIRTLPSHFERATNSTPSGIHMNSAGADTHLVNARANSIDIIRERRISSIISSRDKEQRDIAAWLSTLGSDGKWPDSEVDYATGCAARRANWPAQEHWRRIAIMTAAWHGGLEGADNYTKDAALRAAISLSVDYWFGRDFTNPACADSGGKPACPCDNTENSLWNTNWFSNIILIPGFVGETCLVLGDTLSASQLETCIRMTKRAYDYIDNLTGANTLDVCRIGMDRALLVSNHDLLADAYRRSHLEMQIMNGVKADGIRIDGAFGQHDGMLYNGNYGKDYVNDILSFENEAGGTEFSAAPDSRAAFETLMNGDTWMIFRNIFTGVLHWDFSALGRFISFPVLDDQATGSIKVNLTAVKELGQQWNSEPLLNFEKSLSKPTQNANAGLLEGNRMFFTNDYMVHRGQDYVTTLKMWSSRSRHTECTNSQNPLGFHLADGVLYTYLKGNEYEDIAAAWDWNLIPGITTDYGATPLNCETTKLLGIEDFVGGASTGRVGVAAMRYTNPSTKSLRWQKTWFFLDDDIQHVMISGISSESNVPVYSVLDQRRSDGPVFINGQQRSTSRRAPIQSLWHGGVGYTFTGGRTAVSVQVEQKTGDWSKIGISTQPPATVDLFSAWIEHDSLDTPVSYTIFPGITADGFMRKSRSPRVRSVQNDVHVSAVLDEANDIFMAVFWDAAGGLVAAGSITVSVTANIAVIYRHKTRQLTISDPSQTLSSVIVNVKNRGESKTVNFALPQGGLAGSSVTQNI